MSRILKPVPERKGINPYLECDSCNTQYEIGKKMIKTLPCRHTVCRHCVAAVTNDGKRPFVCPRCRYTSESHLRRQSSQELLHQASLSREASLSNRSLQRQLSQSSISRHDSIPRNVDINNLIGRYDGERKDILGEGPTCESCDRRAHSTAWCSSCAIFLCRYCIYAHKHLKSLSGHKLYALREGNSGNQAKSVYCEKHNTQLMTLFCKAIDCQIPMCKVCVAESHSTSSHEIVELIQVAKEHRKELEKLVDTMVGKEESLLKFVQNAQKMLHEFNTNTMRVERDMKEFFDNCHRALSEREKHLSEQLSTTTHDMTVQIRTQKENVEKIVNRIDSTYQITQHALQGTDDVEIAQVRNQMKITLRNMRTTLDELSSMNVNIQPLANSYVKFKWDHNTSWESYKEIVRKLGELDASNTAPCLTKVTLNAAFAGQECHLLVQTIDYNIRPQNAGGDKISVVILSSDKKSLVTTIMDKKNGLYEVLYVPPTPGNYELTVNVLDQTVSRKDVPLTIHVGSLRHTKFPALVGESSKVLLETFNSKDSLQHIINKMQLTTELHDPRGNVVPINIHYDDAGKFEISFTPMVIGDHHLTLLISGNPIRNNPLIIPVFHKIGAKGPRPGQFNCLTSLAISPKHHRDVFVADTMWNQRIQRITNKGVYNESYMVPYKDFSLINFDDSGNLYILFLNQKRLFTYGVGSGSTLQLRYHSSLPQLQFPHGMAVNSLGQVLISDIGAHCIFVYLQSGSMVKQIGKEGTNRGEFKFPTDICLNIQDQVFVCDMDNHRVQHLDSQGRCMGMFGSDSSLKQPTAVALSTEGYLLVLDRFDLNVVVFFLHTGSIVNRIETNSVASADRLLALHDGYFMKTDNTNHCLQKFKYVEDMGWQSEEDAGGQLRSSAGTPYSLQNGYQSSQYGTYNGSLEEQQRSHSHYSQSHSSSETSRMMNGTMPTSHYSYRQDQPPDLRYGSPRHGQDRNRET